MSAPLLLLPLLSAFFAAGFSFSIGNPVYQYVCACRYLTELEEAEKSNR